MTKSPIPNQALNKAVSRSTHWSYLVIAAAALAACGGGNDATQTPLSTITSSANSIALQKLQPEDSCENQINDTPEKLLACVTLSGVRAHQEKLAEIAKKNYGTRVAGSAGYEASVEYARKVLEDAGYSVTLQPFEFSVYQTIDSSLLEAGQPIAKQITHNVLDYSGSGDVTAAVSAPIGATGCEKADFANFTHGNIALLSRGGDCTLADKVANAIDAGAPGVVIYNDDDDKELVGSLTPEVPEDYPVTIVSKADGERLGQRAGLQLRLKTKTARTSKTIHNILAESVDGDPNHVTMVGAHLDSVRAGPGINDNGSGTSAILETARQMAKVKPVNQLRFALWGAEEQGLIGSRHYVKNLSSEERKRIGIYLNFDMIGSPNHVFYVFGDGGTVGSEASSKIISVFGDFYSQRNFEYKKMGAGGRSDHKPFADVGIPIGGVFSGAEGIKSSQEARIWGGRAGIPYDPCYHRSCDIFSNFGTVALETNAGAVAYSTLHFAMNKIAR